MNHYEEEPHDQNHQSRETAIQTVDGLGYEEIKRHHETAAIAVAAKLKAAVQARYVMAAQRPRNLDKTREALLSHCKRSTFAESAWFKVKRGNKKEIVDGVETGRWVDNFVEGLSVRFAEQALQAYRNAELGAMTLFEDEEKRILRIESTDYESNTGQSVEVTVPKRIERKKLRPNEVPLSKRVNSEGKTTYIVEASDDDISTKQNAAIAKARRNLILMMLPADILEDCKSAIRTTQLAKVKQDPASARKALLDGFASIGVKADDLASYLDGRALDALSPDELLELRAIFVGIRDGEMRWAEVIATKAEPDDESPKVDPAKRAEVKEKLEKKKAEIAAKKAGAAPKKPEPGAESPPEPGSNG